MQKAVLLLPAALAPIHKDHLKILLTAREILQRKGHEVTHVYLLPSSEKYVSNKTGGHFLDSLELRVNLCNLAVKDNDWITVLYWGMASGNKAKKIIEQMHPDTNVFIVAGADTSRNKRDPFLIIVPRSDESASSTRAREAIEKKDWDALYELVDKDVGDEIFKLRV